MTNYSVEVYRWRRDILNKIIDGEIKTLDRRFDHTEVYFENIGGRIFLIIKKYNLE
jgi:hypothetical protein